MTKFFILLGVLFLSSSCEVTTSWLVDIQSPANNYETDQSFIDISGRLTWLIQNGRKKYDESDKDKLNKLSKKDKEKVLEAYNAGPVGIITCGGVEGDLVDKDWTVKGVALSPGANRILCEFNSDGKITKDSVTIIRNSSTNKPPVMIGDESFSANEDISISFTLNGATDPENDELTYTIVEMPKNGTLNNCINADDDLECEFVPNANFFGVDSFRYKANDGHSDSEIETVNLVILSVNDPPEMISDQNFEIDQDTNFEFTIKGASDVDSEHLNYNLVTPPNVGTITGCLNNSESLVCSFAPPTGFVGAVTLSYNAHDGELSSAESSLVTINVKRVIPSDDINPSISMSPNNGDVIRFSTPTLIISYEDNESGINTDSAKIYVDGVELTERLSVGIESATLQFTQEFPLSNGTHVVTGEISDMAGNTSTIEHTYRLELPVITKSFIAGTIIDTDGNPIQGVTISDTRSPLHGHLIGQTDAEGKFAIPFDIAGEYLVTATKPGYVDGSKVINVILGRDFTVGTIILATADSKVTSISAATGGSASNSTGTVNITIPAGALDSDINFSATEFTHGRSLPGPLPELSAFTYAFDMQPRGISYSGGGSISVENYLGFPEGTEIVVGFYDEQLGRWLDSGTSAIVSENKVKTSINDLSKGIKSGVPLPPPFVPVDANQPQVCLGASCKPPTPTICSNGTDGGGDCPKPPARQCSTGGCRIDLYTGALYIDHETPTVKRLNRQWGLQFTYSSITAKPNFFIGTTLKNSFEDEFDSLGGVFGIGPQQQTARAGNKRDNLRLMDNGFVFRTLIEATNPEGKYLSTGSYHFEGDFSTVYEDSEYATAAFFGAPAGVPLGVVARVPVEFRSSIDSRANVVNRRESPFGIGWGLEGLESLHFDPEGTALLDTGADSPFLFTPLGPDHASSTLKSISLVSKVNYKLNLLNKKFGRKGNFFASTPRITSLIAKSGYIYATDCRNNMVYKLNYSGNVEIIAGTGEQGFSGDGGLATQAKLSCPYSVYPRELGGVYIADKGNKRIRMVDSKGIITTIAGNGLNEQSPDLSVAKESSIGIPTSVTEDKMRSVVFTTWNSVRYVGPRGKLHTYSEDNGGHVPAALEVPSQVVFDKFDYPIVVDTNNDRLISLYPQSKHVQTILGLQKEKDGKLVNRGNISRPKTLTYDSLLKRYFILNEVGEVSVWNGNGHHTTTDLNVDRLSGFVSQKKKNMSFREIEEYEEKRLVVNAIAYSPEIGLVLSDGSDILIPQRAFKSSNSNEKTAILSYSGQEGIYKTLTKFDDGTYELEDVYKNKSIFNEDGRLIQKTNLKGQNVSFYYNERGSIQKIVLPTMDSFEFFYNGRGLITQVKDPANRSTIFNHDLEGRVIKIINPDGSSKNFTYTPDHLLKTEQDESQKVTTFEYMESRIIKETRSDGSIRDINPEMLQNLIVGGLNPNDDFSDPSNIEIVDDSFSGDCSVKLKFMNSISLRSKQDCMGNTTIFSTDSNGNITQIYTPEGRIYGRVFDDEGRVTSTTDSRGRTKFEFNESLGVLNTITDENDNQVVMVHDEVGNLISFSDFEGNSSSFTYNGLGQLLSSTDSLNNISMMEHDEYENLKKITRPDGTITEFIRDLAGNVIQVIDSEGHQTSMEYDSLGRILSIQDSLSGNTAFNYFSDGQIESITDARGATTNYEFNNVFKLPSKVTNHLGHSELMSYDANERISGITQKDGSQIILSYDLNSNLLSKDTEDNFLEFKYDRDNLLVEASDSDSYVDISYDNKGRVSSVTQTNLQDHPLLYDYFDDGRRKSVTLYLSGNDGSEVEAYRQNYFYTKNGDVAEIQTKVFDQTVNWSRSFDILNRPITDNINGLIFTDYQFDSLSRFSQIKHSKNNEVIVEYNYTYTPNGNISNILDKGVGYTISTDLTYDQLNRLVSASFEDPFSYDLLGNRTDYGAVYNLINQRVEDNKYINVFDLRGNLTHRTNKLNGEILILTWNNQNQLTKAELVKNSISQFDIFHKYDALNRRIETEFVDKIDDNSYTRKLIYDNEDVILELDGSNNPIAFYVHGAGVDEPLAMIRDIDQDGEFEANETFYFLKDHLNSVRELVDHTGKIYQRYTYSAYGETKIAKHDRNSNFVENRFAYTSREIDEHTGLYYYRARWYDSNSGRFLSEDPIGFRGGDTNLYRYVENNPINYYDPLGLLSFSENLARRQGINKNIVKKIGEQGSKLIIGSSVLRAGGFVSLIEGFRSGFDFANLGRIGTIGSIALGTALKAGAVTASFGTGFYLGDYLGAYLDTVVDDGSFGSTLLESLYFGSGHPNTPKLCGN